MTTDQLNLLREWIRAEIDVKIAEGELGADGYYGKYSVDHKEADRLFEKVVESLKKMPNIFDFLNDTCG